MIDADALPIPDWGLRCPRCDAPLAGMPEHQCERCGQAFNIRYLLGVHKPIADIGLTCRECRYLLRGLMDERCPECGTKFSVRAMLEDQSPFGGVDLMGIADPDDHYVKKREPRFTGRERPLPDFGLVCAECGHALAGAPADVCPACGLGFDLSAVVPGGDWVNVSGFVPATVRAMARSILYDARIPYVVDDARWRQLDPFGLPALYGGRMPFTSSRLRIPRKFFFDALCAFSAAQEPPPDYAQADWVCPACNERVPGGFEVCWNCNTPHPNQPADEDG